MQLLIVTIAVLSLLKAVEATHTTCSNTFRLFIDPRINESIYNDVSYGSVALAGDHYDISLEPLILTYPYGGETGGGSSFTSYHSAPTGWQNPYVYPKDIQPLGFTIPHSAYVPRNANTTYFSVEREGDKRFLFNGCSRWFACLDQFAKEGTRVIYWIPEGAEVTDNCTEVTLKTQAYGYGDRCA